MDGPSSINQVKSIFCCHRTFGEDLRFTRHSSDLDGDVGYGVICQDAQSAKGLVCDLADYGGSGREGGNDILRSGNDIPRGDSEIISSLYGHSTHQFGAR